MLYYKNWGFCTMNKMMIGWAEESLVPEKKVSLAGQFYERISEFVESDINATAMAVECGDQQAIFISCDITSFSEFLVDRIREKFAEMNDEVSPDKLIMSATHTHTSVNHRDTSWAAISILNEFLPEGKKYTKLVETNDEVISPKEAREFLADRIASAAKKAWDNRQESLYANAFGRAAIGFCRRVCYDDGSAQMWGDTNTANFTALEGGNDSGVELLYIFDKSKKLTGIVANVACPAQILEHRSFISSDFWGKAKEYVRKELGDHIYLLTLCGAAGDQCPRDLVRWVNPETPVNDPHISRPNYIERTADPSMFDISGCRLAGKRLANEIVSVYEEITEIKDEPIFEHSTFVIDLPLRKASMKDYNNAVREIEYYVEKNKDKDEFDYHDTAAINVHAGTINRYRIQQNQQVVPTEIHIIRLGDIAIASNPFELYLDYGNQIKARSHAKQTFISQLTCGGLSYLPTEKAQKGGHYSAYISSGVVGYEGGDILVRKTIHEINKLFESSKTNEVNK